MRSLLERQGSAPLDATVADRVLQAAAGNPLTLLELPLTLSPEQRVGREGAESILHARATAEEAFLHRIVRLPVGSATRPAARGAG